MKSALILLAERMGEFAAGLSGFSFDPTWGEIAGRGGLLLAAARETLLAPAPDHAAPLAACIGLLDRPETASRIDAYYRTVLRATSPASEQFALEQSARIRRNAIGLLGAAQVAVGARAAERATPPQRVWAEWLRLGSRPSRAMAVPIVGHYAGKGFLAELQLTPIYCAQPVAVEHPELALDPLGAQLLEAVAAQARQHGASFLWQIVVRDELGGNLAPLNGDSLGAALAAGVELMSRRLTYHPGCLLIGRVIDGGRLGHTGFEREKLLRASAASFSRIGIAMDSELTDSDLQKASPLILHRLGTVREAVEFAAASRLVPYL